MRVFNRVVMILSILVWIALVVYVMILPLDAVYYARTGLDYFEKRIFDDQFFYTFLASGGGLLLILLLLFWLEIRRVRRKTVRVKTKGKGNAHLGIQSVAQSLEYRIDELAGVRKVEPRITSRGRDVEVALDLDTSPSVNLPVLTDQIMRLCHDIIEGQLGIKIRGKVNINISHEPYPRGTMPSTQPLGVEPVVSPPTVAPTPPQRRVEPRAPISAEPVRIQVEPDRGSLLEELPEEGESEKEGTSGQENDPSAW